MNRLDYLLVPPGIHRPPVVAVAMANDPEVIRCISRAASLGLARFILIGPHKKILSVASTHGALLSNCEFVDETDDVAACNRAAELVRENRAQVIMKGLVHTSTFSRAFLNKDLGLVVADNLVSHVALFDIKTYHKLLIITDAALNIDPDVPRKVGIMKNAIAFALRIGIHRPKVALISAVEKVNPKIKSTVDAREIVSMAERGDFDGALVDGPFGLDIAVSPDAAKVKGVESEVAGDADILLFPNIVSANVLYKSLTQFNHARVAGTIIGARCPVVITSRSDSEEVKLHSLALAVKSIAPGSMGPGKATDKD